MYRLRVNLLPLLILFGLGQSAVLRAEPIVPAAKKYEAVAQRLSKCIERELREKDLPAVSIALVDDQTIVWAHGFGFADPKTKKPATADTVYRVGSVSKLFTDLAIMQLVERGVLDLDAPITKYLPDFKPGNPFDQPITLRQMMAHRSGLVREPPIGNYFDPTGPSLAKMVESLNKTELVYKPETKTKYSNAAIATVGFVLEETQKQPFARYLWRTLLDPLGMKHSGFEPDPALTKDLAKAVMWTYPGREFPAPTFELGMSPAGSMYTNVLDLGRFLSVLFAGGKGPHGQVVKPETLEQMWTLQFVKKDDKKEEKEPKEGFGLGFYLSELDGHKSIGHGGAVYGFATQLQALPKEKLGVVVVASRDVANGVTNHIAEIALKQMLAAKEGKPLPAIEETTRIPAAKIRKLAGRYKSGDKEFDLLERDGRLWVLPARGGYRQELRALGDELIVDDRMSYGPKFTLDGEKIRVGKDTYERVPVTKPKPCPEKWRGLLGEYGWDHNTLVILERDGKLNALIEWVFLYPLEEVSANEFKFPEYGLYLGEKLIFTRDERGRATKVEAASVVFERRKIDGENGETFKIKPLHPVEELRGEALKAKPPEEKGDFRKPELVELVRLDDTIKLDIRYATTNNFLSTPFYSSAKAFMQKPAAEALVRVHKKLAEQGYGLLVYDGYRPWSVTKMFWDATPEKLRLFVADPSQGSRHNRGCAVDLTLYDRKTGKTVEMIGGYDEMSDRSYPDYLGGTSSQRYHRDLLRRAMQQQGFTVYEAEWWHFDYKDWRKYPILNKTLEQLEVEKPRSSAGVKTLFDFENAADLKAWSNLELPDAKQKEPAAKFELSTEHVTSGKHSLKITFAGGRWPTLTTTQIPADWLSYQTFKADVTVTRPCLVGFTVLQEKSRRSGDWDGVVSRWCKTELLRPGSNEVTGVLHPPNDYSLSGKWGKVVRFEMFLYAPHNDEAIWVDNIRLTTSKEAVPPVKTAFRVLGTDWAVSGVQELGKKLQDRWSKPETRTIEQVETAFRTRYEQVKKDHPRALLAILRDGQKGGDPAHPDAVYMGWKDAYWSSHGPDGMTVERADNRGRAASHEVFMRHRSPLMRVDLSSIPQGAKILAAQLAIVRAGDFLKEHNPESRPTMWVAEACNRPWEEYEVNAYEYAKDKFWKAIGGQFYGDDPDFLPIYLAYGPGGGRQANVWDFAEAVRFWTSGKHVNHGFMLHGDSRDYLTAFTREAKEIKNRPALLVIYEPN